MKEHDMTTLTATAAPATRLRPALRWLGSFVGFPLGGLAAMVLVGHVDSRPTAVLGGLVTGAVLGVVQAAALRTDRRTTLAWVVTTAFGLSAGLATGSTAVGYATGIGDLAIQGLASGAVVGLLQALVLRDRLGALAALWPAYLAGAYALGWTITTAVGVQVEDQFTIFGAAGAITVAALTTVLPVAIAHTIERNDS
jgi:hypothetical protein